MILDEIEAVDSFIESPNEDSASSSGTGFCIERLGKSKTAKGEAVYLPASSDRQGEFRLPALGLWEGAKMPWPPG